MPMIARFVRERGSAPVSSRRLANVQLGRVCGESVLQAGMVRSPFPVRRAGVKLALRCALGRPGGSPAVTSCLCRQGAGDTQLAQMRQAWR